MNKLYIISLLIIQKAPWLPVRLLLAFFGSFEVKGLENLRTLSTNAIFACNHASELDIPLLPAAIPFWSRHSPMFYASREKEFYGGSGWRRHFYGGIIFNMLGSFSLSVGLRDYNKALSNQIKIVNDGRSLCIFPEGGTTPNGMIQPFKGGVVYLAYLAKIPVVPVRLEGTYHFSLSTFLRRRIKLSVSFGKPLYYLAEDEGAIPIKDCKEMASKIRDIIINMV